MLPWELLPDPTAQDSNGVIAIWRCARRTRGAAGARTDLSGTTTYLEPPLNLLIVLSSPTPQNKTEDWLAFDIFEVKQNLLAELSPLVDAGLLTIDVEDRPTVENLRRCIGKKRRGYHLFHYVGHALPDRVILEDRAGKREDLSSGRLVELLRLCPDLRLHCLRAARQRAPRAIPKSSMRATPSAGATCSASPTTAFRRPVRRSWACRPFSVQHRARVRKVLLPGTGDRLFGR